MPNTYFYKPGDPRNPAQKRKAIVAKYKATCKAKKKLTQQKPLEKPKQNQPKKQLGKTKRALTARAKIIIHEIINGATEAAALKAAGYSDSCVAYRKTEILHNPQIQKTFRDVLDSAGVTDDRIADKIASLMDARETKFFAHQGEIINEKQVDALSIQAEMVQFAAKLRGHVIDRSASLNVTVTLTDRIKSARERLQSKPVDNPVYVSQNG